MRIRLLRHADSPMLLIRKYSTQTLRPSAEHDTVKKLISVFSTPCHSQSSKDSLKTSQIPTSNFAVDGVLKRVRFSQNRRPSSEYGTVKKIFGLINSSPDSESFENYLKASQIPISNVAVHEVLKMVRVSRTDPLLAFVFFRFASRNEGFSPTPYSFNSMLYLLGKNSKFEQMWDLLSDYSKKDKSLITPRAVQTVLNRIAKVYSVWRTVESFRRLQEFVLEFDVSCYNTLFRTLCREKSTNDARKVYLSLKSEFRPNLQTFNILLSELKLPEEAEAFLCEMKEKGVEPDVVTYKCLVDVYSKGGDVGKVYKVTSEMRENGIDLDVRTYISLIRGLGLVGEPDKAREVLKEMKDYGCYPNVAVYNAVIGNFCIAKRLGDAYSVLEEMVGLNLSPNAPTYNLFFRTYDWANDLRSSWDVYLRMRRTRCLPNTKSYLSLMGLIKRHKKVDKALELWGDMIEMRFESCVLVSDVLFAFLCDMGKLEEAERCFLQMVEKGQKPSHDSFRRIKALMELTNKNESLSNLSKKMSALGSRIHLRKKRATTTTINGQREEVHHPKRSKDHDETEPKMHWKFEKK